MKRLCILLITLGLCLPAQLAAEDWFYAKRVDDFTDQETHIAMVRSVKERSLALARCLQEEEFDLIFLWVSLLALVTVTRCVTG
ncbi:hypothetical protein [Aliamphritea spongicola]|nr:hypothetical protein [Aliamphritea spongicola]